MSATRIKKRRSAKVCDLCHERSDLCLLVGTTEKERLKLGGADFFEIRLCASCAGTPGVTDRLLTLLNFTFRSSDPCGGLQ
jgi:hypothetical protein